VRNLFQKIEKIVGLKNAKTTSTGIIALLIIGRWKQEKLK